MNSIIGITLTQIKYALAVKQTGKFSEAAKLCHVSQPSLSESIQKLEQELGVIIFDRKKNPIRSTEIGQAVLEQMQVILIESERLYEVSQLWKKETKGELKIGLIPTLASSMIPLFFKGLRQKYPDVKLVIIENTTQRLLELLSHGEVDCAILSTPNDAPIHFIEKFLFYESFVVYAAKENPILKNTEISFEHLQGQDILLMDETHCLRDQTQALCSLKRQSKTVQTTVNGGIATLLSVVDQVGGMTFLPELIAEGLAKEVKKNQLRQFEDSKFSRKVSLLFNKTYLKRRLIDILTGEILQNIPTDVHTKKNRGEHVLDPATDRFD